MLQDWQDRAASNKDTLLEVSQGPVVSPLAGRSLCGTSLVVEPCSASRQEEINHLLVLGTLKLGGFSHFWRKKDRITEHELSVNVVSVRVVGEFVPHRSHERLGRASSLLEAGVDVVNKVVALVDSSSDCSLDPGRLEPRFTVRGVDLCMCPEEWVKSAQLVELNVKIVTRLTVEPWNIRPTEGVASNTELEKHAD